MGKWFLDGMIILIAVLHLYFMVLEMILWTHPIGLKTFGQSVEEARQSAVLAANQGLYNGFLVAGLVWSVVHPQVEVAWQLRVFFLGCVLVAGLYGAWTVGRKILFVQALPAAVALSLCLSL